MLSNQAAQRLLVLRVDVGVEQADRYSSILAIAQLGNQRPFDFRLIERSVDAAVCQQTFVHFEAAAATDNRYRRLIFEVVDVRATMALQRQDVTESGGGHKRGEEPLSFQHRVGGHC